MAQQQQQPPPSSAAASAAAAASADDDDAPIIDVAALTGDKIKALMRRDPKFITRLIAELDKQMHSKMAEKARRAEEAKADAAELAKVDAAIDGHVRPCLERLRAQIANKEALRARVAAQLDGDMQRFKDMEREAAALCTKIRHANSKLMSRTARAALQEARGFTATTPTSELIRGSGSGGSGGGARKASAAAGAAAGAGGGGGKGGGGATGGGSK